LESKPQRSSSSRSPSSPPPNKPQGLLFELEPLRPGWRFEEELSSDGYRIICGVDDAGRGPLAGLVSAACVIFKERKSIPGLNDSKALSPMKREELYAVITASPHIDYGVGMSSVEEIDGMNILNATFLAVRRALEQLKFRPDAILIDGSLPVTGVPCFQKPVVKGDARCCSIAAASILAKVSRDRWIDQASRDYPCYEFDKHKGYGTLRHMELLNKFGPCPLHRKTFEPVKTIMKRS